LLRLVVGTNCATGLAEEEPLVAMLTHYLVSMQDRLHLSDPEFARQLGVDAETWQVLRAGHAAYTPTILARLLLHVPNAHALALDELRHQEQLTTLQFLDGAFAAPANERVEQPSPIAEVAQDLAYAA
jgi:hypothetical protein